MTIAVSCGLVGRTETDDPLAIFSEAFAGQTAAVEVEVGRSSVKDRLRKPIDGRKRRTECLIDEALESIPPLDITVALA